MDACSRANELLHNKLNEAIDAIEKGEASRFDKALDDMVKTRKSMELGGCSIVPLKETGFKKPLT
jgi:hypothetical protein